MGCCGSAKQPLPPMRIIPLPLYFQKKVESLRIPPNQNPYPYHDLWIEQKQLSKLQPNDQIQYWKWYQYEFYPEFKKFLSKRELTENTLSSGNPANSTKLTTNRADRQIRASRRNEMIQPQELKKKLGIQSSINIIVDTNKVFAN